jgi:hypothetical protein
MRHQTLEHCFVRHVPRELDPGVLYISMDYATAVHSCCCGCGCGGRVVTPLTPTDWRMTFDGESISLRLSVGNWNQKCRSQYVIQRNRVLEDGAWSASKLMQSGVETRGPNPRITASRATLSGALLPLWRTGRSTRLPRRRLNRLRGSGRA